MEVNDVCSENPVQSFWRRFQTGFTQTRAVWARGSFSISAPPPSCTYRPSNNRRVKLLRGVQMVQLDVLFIRLAQMDFLAECQNLNL